MNIAAEFKQYATGNQLEVETKDPRYAVARDDFWEYCKLISPKFYKDSRPHLKKIARTLQALYEGRIIKLNSTDHWEVLTSEELAELTEIADEYLVCKNLMMNVPPRHGKSYTLVLFAQWLFGKSIERRIITATYGETLSTRFSAAVRDGIDATK